MNEYIYKQNLKYLFFVFVVFLLVTFVVGVCQFIGNWMWGDEAETLVTVQQMGRGQQLYKDVFNIHGPLYFIPFAILPNFFEGIQFVYLCRLIVILSFWGFFLYIGVLIKNVLDVASSLIFISCLIALELVVIFPNFGYMYLYQNITGILVAVVFSIFLICLFSEICISKQQIIICSLIISSLSLISISNSLTTLFLFVEFFILSYKSKLLKETLKYTLLFSTLYLMVLCFYIDFKGFYVVHYYIINKYLLNSPSLRDLLLLIKLNFSNPACYIPFGLFLVLSFGALPNDKCKLICYVQLLVLVFALVFLYTRDLVYVWKPWLALQHLYCVSIGSVVCFLFFIRNYKILYLRYLSLGFISILLLLNYVYFMSEENEKGAFLKQIYSNESANTIDVVTRQLDWQSKFSFLVKKFTHSDEKIVAWTFRPFEYLLSEREPATSNFQYILRWDFMKLTKERVLPY